MDPSSLINNGVDFISSMPDEILHRILSFLPINLAIRTSFLSRRWRHVWRETPCLDFNRCRREATAGWIDQALSFHRAPKITSFDLSMPRSVPDQPHAIDRWIEFALSRNVEKLSLNFVQTPETYNCPDSLYLSSSLTQLRVVGFDMIPRCTVSWKSLRKLTFFSCNLFDESIANILSGSPVLETLIFFGCAGLLEPLDLRKSPSLRRLEIDPGLARRSGPMEIIAPHIHHLSFTFSEEPSTFVDASSLTTRKPSTLVDVSSLTEASLDIGNIILPCFTIHNRFPFNLMADFFQTMVLKMLAKLQNVERLTFGGNLLQILSLAELRGVPFPTLKVQTLTLKTSFARSAIPGIARLLQKSPGLKKLIAHATWLGTIEERYLDSYLDAQGLDPDQCWRSSKYEVFPTSAEFDTMLRSCCKDATPEVVASFKEMVLREVKQPLETLVVRVEYIDELDFEKWIKELFENTL